MLSLGVRKSAASPEAGGALDGGEKSIELAPFLVSSFSLSSLAIAHGRNSFKQERRPATKPSEREEKKDPPNPSPHTLQVTFPLAKKDNPTVLAVTPVLDVSKTDMILTYRRSKLYMYSVQTANLVR